MNHNFLLETKVDELMASIGATKKDIKAVKKAFKSGKSNEEVIKVLHKRNLLDKVLLNLSDFLDGLQNAVIESASECQFGCKCSACCMHQWIATARNVTAKIKDSEVLEFGFSIRNNHPLPKWYNNISHLKGVKANLESRFIQILKSWGSASTIMSFYDGDNLLEEIVCDGFTFLNTLDRLEDVYIKVISECAIDIFNNNNKCRMRCEITV